jgi:hypothetical protein
VSVAVVKADCVDCQTKPVYNNIKCRTFETHFGNPGEWVPKKSTVNV